jgi:hypothetical protein
MKKRIAWALLALPLFFLVSCTPSTTVDVPEATAFFEEVIKDSSAISKGRISKHDKVYLTVEYTLTTDDFPAADRESVFKKTSEFFESPKIKELLVEKIGSENANRMLNEGFTIRFQNPKTDTYWVYRKEENQWSLVE